MDDCAKPRHPCQLRTRSHGVRALWRGDLDRYPGDRRAANKAVSGKLSSAALIGVEGRFRNRRFAIPPGRSTIGRNAANGIVIDTHGVSMVHARMLQKDGEWWVLNLVSSNGTYVNDQRVKESILRDGDRLRFAEAQFIFHQATVAAPRGLGTLMKLARSIRALLLHRPKPA